MSMIPTRGQVKAALAAFATHPHFDDDQPATLEDVARGMVDGEPAFEAAMACMTAALLATGATFPDGRDGTTISIISNGSTPTLEKQDNEGQAQTST